MFGLKKTVSLSLALLLVLLTLAACGKSTSSSSSSGSSATPAAPASASPAGGNAASGKKDEFNFYFTGSLNVKELWEALVPEFQKKNPNITVKLVYIDSGSGGGDAVMDKMTAAKQAGQKSGGVDLFESSLADVNKGAGLDLWTPVDAKQIPNLSKVEQKNMDETKSMAVPYRSSSVILAYNSTKVPTPPKTATELYDWIRKNPGRFAYNDPTTGGSGDSFVQTAIYNFLPPEASTKQDPAIMSQWDKGFALLKELKPSMYQKGVFPKKNQGTLDLLASGEVDMIPAWSDQVLEQKAKKTLPDNIKYTNIDPPFTGGPTYLMVPKLGEHLDSVYKFLDFALSVESQTVIVNKMNGYPGIKWSEMPAELRDKFKDIQSGFRTFNLGPLGKEIQKRWQAEVAGQ